MFCAVNVFVLAILVFFTFFSVVNSYVSYFIISTRS